MMFPGTIVLLLSLHFNDIYDYCAQLLNIPPKSCVAL